MGPLLLTNPQGFPTLPAQGAVAKWLRQRIANPPSPVRIRAAPLLKPVIQRVRLIPLRQWYLNRYRKLEGTVRLFISWSGTRSHSIAMALNGWIPLVIQAIEPWLSSDDIQIVWLKEIEDILSDVLRTRASD